MGVDGREVEVGRDGVVVRREEAKILLAWMKVYVLSKAQTSGGGRLAKRAFASSSLGGGGFRASGDSDRRPT